MNAIKVLMSYSPFNYTAIKSTESCGRARHLELLARLLSTQAVQKQPVAKSIPVVGRAPSPGSPTMRVYPGRKTPLHIAQRGRFIWARATCTSLTLVLENRIIRQGRLSNSLFNPSWH